MIVLTWAVYAGLLLLFGRAASGVFPGRQRLGGLAAFWAGLALFLGYIQVWHLVLPARAWAWGPVVVIAAGQAWSDRSNLRNLPLGARTWNLSNRTYAVLVLLSVFWLARLSVQEPFFYDAGLYHLQAIQWADKYPVVPGLGNLHNRLGFNTAWFPFVSSLGFGPWRGHQAHLSTGLVIAPLLALQGRCLLDLVQQRTFRADHVVGAVLLPATFSQVSFGWVSSPGVDQPLYALVVVTAIYALRSGREPHLAPVAVLLAAAAVLVRLQAAPFSAAVCVIMLATSFRCRASQRDTFRGVTVSVVISAVAAGVYVGRGLVTSGYPFFPLDVGAVDVDWRVPRAEAREAHLSIVDFSRNAARGQEGWSWIPHWWASNNDLSTLRFGLVLAVFGIFVTVFALAVRGHRELALLSRNSLGWIWGAALLGVAAWFLAAPNPRLGMGVIWVFAATTLAVAIALLPGVRTRAMAFIPVFLLLLAQAGWALLGSHQIWPAVPPGSGPFGTVQPPRPAVVSVFGTARYRVPAAGDQCWNRPIPCADGLHPLLRQRSDTLSDGFAALPAIAATARRE